jgi:tRNA uracil 4-sulfurtransferase
VDIRTIAEQAAQEQVPEVETVAAFGADRGRCWTCVRRMTSRKTEPLAAGEGRGEDRWRSTSSATQFGDLDQSKTYLLYCERGVMSRLQALYLLEQGFNNVKVYRP